MSIVNITATVQIEPQDIVVVNCLPEAWYQKKKVKRQRHEMAFQCARLRKPNSRVVFLIYRTGKCVCLGAKGERDVHDACSWLANLLNSRIVAPPLIRNIVYCYSLESGPVDIETLYEQLVSTHFSLPKSVRRHFGTFEPELSPAFIYIPKSVAGVKALLFRPGKVNLTGLKDQLHIDLIVSEINQLLIPKWRSLLLSTRK